MTDVLDVACCCHNWQVVSIIQDVALDAVTVMPTEDAVPVCFLMQASCPAQQSMSCLSVLGFAPEGHHHTCPSKDHLHQAELSQTASHRAAEPAGQHARQSACMSKLHSALERLLNMSSHRLTRSALAAFLASFLAWLLLIPSPSTASLSCT